MSFKHSVAAFALSMTIATPAFAFTGVGGCSGLPEYYRALGALQGNMESACNMSVDQARRILQTYGYPVVQTVAPPRVVHRSYRVQ